MSPSPVRIDLPLPCGETLHPYCRKLIKEGANPEALAEVYRGDTLVFNPTTIGWFADRSIQESDKGFKRVKYREFPETAFHTPQDAR